MNRVEKGFFKSNIEHDLMSDQFITTTHHHNPKFRKIFHSVLFTFFVFHDYPIAISFQLHKIQVAMNRKKDHGGGGAPFIFFYF